MNSLEKYREEVSGQIEKAKADVVERREKLGYEDYGAYPINELERSVHFHDVEAEYIDREQFGADVALKSPTRLKELGSKEYISSDAPALASFVRGSHLVHEEKVVTVEQKGLYVNAQLSDSYLYSTLRRVLELGSRFGMSDVYRDAVAVVDYSSPNAAKHLHPGHIRSTIIGHVLSTIYEAAGYTVYRINHINDWGGFGFLIEGYDRWKNELDGHGESNDLLYAIYLRYRDLEKHSEESDEAKLAWDEFASVARERFNRLEAGAEKEVMLWRKMVGWSMEEFNAFYSALRITHDMTVGESFYAARGDELVNEVVEAGGVETLADGAVVVPLGEEEQLVIRRADESSIYATRDLAAIEHRVKTFSPALLSYVVGEEQTDHFSKLFRAARRLNIAPSDVTLTHLPFGLYIDATTKKKLSSRNGAQDVMKLLETAVSYFEASYTERGEFTDEEKNENAHLLAVGSIAFNDVKKERRFPIEFHSDLRANVSEFEQSGGAYVMYASARARSIVRKYGKALPSIDESLPKTLEPVEVSLVKKINEMPRVVVRAAEFNNPAALAMHLVTLAQAYNSYYEQCPVLSKDGEPTHLHRLVITHAVAQVLDNGLRLCHAQGPERI